MTKGTKKGKGNSMDVNAVLNKAVNDNNSKKKKSSVPVLDVSAEVQKSAGRIREIKAEVDSLTSECKTLASEIVEEVTPLREQTLRHEGYTPSIRIPDNNNKFITITWAHKYSFIPYTQKGELERTFTNKFDYYFEPQNAIKVKDGLGDEKLAELIELVGAERLEEFFDITQTIVVKTTYTEEYHTLPKKKKEQAAIIVKQYSPSIKTK